MSTNNQYVLEWTGGAGSIKFAEFKTWFDGFMKGIGDRQVTPADLAEIQKMMDRVIPDTITLPQLPTYPDPYKWPYGPIWIDPTHIRPYVGDGTGDLPDWMKWQPRCESNSSYAFKINTGTNSEEE